ncbi:Alanine racemase, biosynthetic [Candidatus Arsenophonus lipoptenae]|uniref:Alanine racemase n=1 Tax=Candidatus Arsenophonus lipoptenae TaxID=634113 RepID=A0A109Q9L8_9GAMM|nr:alanine racemase [Candidatus Arsenophonus lipoptenae]AMA64816.1 Alanine racemase, biosynthetic [Candidatus Arsenophonus lipoptenae]
MKSPVAVIHSNAIRYNLLQIRKIVVHSRIMAIIKANAYGHGLLEIAKILKDLADGFGVARISEAIMLRNNDITNPILLLAGFVNINELPIIIKNEIDVVIQDIKQIEILEKIKLQKLIKVWMKIDTGMHRLGFRPEEAEILYKRLIECKNIQKPINIISHFSMNDKPGLHDIAFQQLNCFNNFIKNKLGEKSIASSIGILLWQISHLDWVRPGIMIYGASPQEGKQGKDFGLLPAMTLKSYLIAIRKHKAGEPIGYGGIWISDHDTTIGIVAIGYGDGYPSNAPSGTPILINGRKVPIVGKVSMDMTSVNLGINSHDKVGDEAIIWGDLLPVEEIAKHTGISHYELLTKLTSRVLIKYQE